MKGYFKKGDLIISYDDGRKSGEAELVLGRLSDGKVDIIETFYGQDAKDKLRTMRW